LITGREDYLADLRGTGGTAKTRASGQVSVVAPGRLGVMRGREPGPFGTMEDGTGADGSAWMGRNISSPCIKA